MTDLTIQDRLRVHAATGGGSLDPDFLREMASTIDIAQGAVKSAVEHEARGNAAYGKALVMHKKATLLLSFSLVICFSAITIAVLT